MKRLLFLSFFAFPGLVACEPIDEAFYQELKKVAHPKAFAKLEKALTFNPDNYYQKKCVAHWQLLRDKVEKQLSDKVENAQKELYKIIPEWSKNKFNDESKNIDRSGVVEFAIKYESTPKEKSLDDSIMDAIKHNASTFEIPESIRIIARYPRHLIEKKDFRPKTPSVSYRVDEGKTKFAVFYEHDFFENVKNTNAIKALFAHELTHIKFKDVISGANLKHNPLDPQTQKFDSQAYESLFSTMAYFQEMRADIYPAAHSLEIAAQLEEWMFYLLFDRLETSSAVSYNHPTKGTPNGYVHPSDLLRWAKLRKTRKVLEAEKRWFKTAEADKRYGNAYYEIAFAKAYENKESLKRWKKIQLNAF